MRNSSADLTKRSSGSFPPRSISGRRVVRAAAILLTAAMCAYAAFAAIPISTSTASTQNFDGIGTVAVATLPADFRVDRPATVRTVGTFAAAATATQFLGGANLSSSASNGIYNFGAGTNTTGADRAVGFLSSGTATASGNLYAQLVNNTGATLTGLQISYNVEKYRGGLNPAGFRIQVFYSTDGSTWTNAGSDFLTSFGPDAANTGFATAPGVTVAVSNKNLNVSIPDGGNFFLAWNYSVASGTTTTNAQALAIDDISILGSTSASTNPAGAGAANPATVQAGNSSLLTIAVTPGANPVSTGLAVNANLSAIGGSATQQFFDDGTHGDLTAGDNVFSLLATVPGATSAGAKILPATITDAQSRTGSASISLTVTPLSTPPTGTGSATPASLQEGGATLLTVNVTPGSNPVSTGISVVGDLHLIGGSASQQFFNDGTNGDAVANDNIFSFQTVVASGTSAGLKPLPVTISDAQARSSTSAISLTVQPPPPPTTVKISQVYGGGGNSGSTYTNDFIEIYNQAQTSVDLTGWSVQYSSPTTSTWTPTSICPTGPCVLQPGHYFLVRESQGAGGTTSLPAPDATGTIAMGATSGKVALVANTTALTGACPTGGIVDLIGYGTANCSETTPTPVLTNTTAAVRRGNGCIDTDNNLNDFVPIGPIPRNSAAPANSCGGDPSQPSGLGVASPSSVDPASNTLLTVRVTPATTPPSSGVSVVGDLTSLGGVSSQPFFDDGTHGDQTAGDNVFSFQATVGPDITTGVKNIVATIADAQGRAATAPITLTVQSPSCGVERWSVKVGTDPDVSLVDLNHVVPTTIFDLGSIPAPVDPPGPPDNARVAPTETTVYVVNALMTFYKKETDVDYHIVLQDPAGHTLIAEIPNPACILAPNPSGPGRILVPSPLGPGIAAARARFDARLTATPDFQTANIPVQVKGVAFFDFEHGQTGIAPNGIELHPVLEINFQNNTTTVLTSSANPSQFGQPVTITATVSNGGTPTPAGNVTFFDNGASVGSVALDGTGAAVFTTSALPAGPHSFTASYEGDSTSAPGTSGALPQVVNKADQTINFAPIAAKTFGDPDFTASASASSGLAVTFSIVSGPAVIFGNAVHITGAGTVMVRASQSGDSNYNAATDADQPFTVSRAAQTITFVAPENKTYGDAAFVVTASGGASGNSVTFVAQGNCSASGLNGGLIAITGAGSCTVTASQAGNGNYNAAPDVPRSFTINRASAVFIISDYSGIYDGLAHGAGGSATGVNGEDLSALLNLGQSFTDVPGGTAAWLFAGNANYNPSSGTAAIVIAKATPSFSNLSSPEIIFGTGTTDLSGKLSAGALIPTGNAGITLNGVTQNAAIQADGSFSSSFATASLAPATPAYTIAYTYGGDRNFNPASGAGTLTVGYAIVPLYDPTKAFKSGSTIGIKLQLNNADGLNVSSAAIVVTALRVVQTSTNAVTDVQDPGDSNPDNNFRLEGSKYAFNLSTKGFATGSYSIEFTISGDPVTHSLPFQLR